MTSPLHGEGPGFNPLSDYFILLLEGGASRQATSNISQRRRVPPESADLRPAAVRPQQAGHMGRVYCTTGIHHITKTKHKEASRSVHIHTTCNDMHDGKRVDRIGPDLNMEHVGKRLP